uniref:Chromogranin-A n=1 Tax=Cavia porcellus TaxID=10141 RepID=H0VR23_CAVPO
MRSCAVLAFLLCAGQVTALPVNSPMTKGDTEVMKCIVEVISDSLSKPSPMPVSQECLEILQGDERILSILRHQNLLRELQDLARQGIFQALHAILGKCQTPSSFQKVGSSMPPGQSVTDAEAVKPGRDAKETSSEATEGAGPQALPEPGQGSMISRSNQTPSEEEEDSEEEVAPAAPDTQPPANLPSEKRPDSEEDLGTQEGQPAKREEEEEQEEEEEAGKKAGPGEEDPTAALSSHQDLNHAAYSHLQPGSHLEALAVNGAGKTGAEEAQPPEGMGEQEQEEDMAGAPPGPFRGGKSGELEPEEERLSRKWEDSKRWSKMDQLAKELAEDEGEEDPDRSMKLSFRAQAYGFPGPEPQLRRDWRPSSREDSIEAARSFPEEKKEEEGSANRRAEDQELESLSAIEAELEKVAHQLQALRRG